MMYLSGYRLLNTWIGKVFLFGLVAQPICCTALPGSAQTSAQTIVPDATLGTEQSQVAVDVEIRGRRATRIGGGSIRGRNLFHSFQTFSIEAGQRVYFANPGNIRNIFSRVTGGNRSNIAGTLGVTGTANLFLLNPNGILFGPDAELDLRGSFFATTADRFIFADGSLFSATNPQPVLTVSVPTGVQFGRIPGEIQVRTRSNIRSNASPDAFELPSVGGLQVAAHRTLALVGGSVTLDGGVLSVEDGRIELGSVANSGFANLNPVEAGWNVGYGGPQRPARNFQAITLSGGAVVSGSGTEGSVIQLRSRNLNLADAAQIIASVSDGESEQANRKISVAPEEMIRIVVAETLSLEEDAQIATLAVNGGSVGNLTVTGQSINLRDGSRIEALADSSSSPGNINIEARNLSIAGRSAEGASGIFARVEVTPAVDESPDEPEEPPESPESPESPDTLTDDQSETNNNAFANTTITLNVSPSDDRNDSNGNVADSVVNQTPTQTEREADSGYLTIAVDQTLRLSDGAEIAILAQEAQTGDINLAVGNLQANQSRLWTQVGRGGAITVKAERANLRQSQISTEQRFDADDIDEDDPASSGAANLQFRAQRLSLQENSKISTQSAAEGANLRIRTPLLVVNQSDLATQGGTERGANVTIRADLIRLTDSDLNLVAGSGGGANIRMQALNSALELNAVSSHLGTQSAVETGANLTVAAQSINLNDSTFTTVSGAAGGANIRLLGSDASTRDFLRPSDLVLLMQNRSQLQTRSAARGGNILIDAQQIRALPGSDSDIIALPSAQQGGRIKLELLNEETDLIGFRQGRAIPGNGTNDIDSSTGVVIRELPVIDLPEVELPSEALEASDVIAQGCGARRSTAHSPGRFSVTGRRGLPLTPYEPISNSDILSDLRLPSEPTPLVEAQGWQVDRSGVITLVAEQQPQPCEEP
jgi:filamentous hemagglutinin family protein